MFFNLFLIFQKNRARFFFYFDVDRGCFALARALFVAARRKQDTAAAVTPPLN